MGQRSDTTLSLELLTSLRSIPAAQWDAVANTDYPFLSHHFLLGLETTGCTTAETGWQPCHAILRRGDRLVALMPTYLKSHSYGEYVFDWSWADAWQRQGLNYYPKLVSGIPFTPATGPRLCIAADMDPDPVYAAMLAGIQQWAEAREISSWHCLFPSAEDSARWARLGTCTRVASQFHWFNEGYTSFDDFLASCSARKRKNLKRERRRVQEQGIELQTLTGSDLTREHWERFYHFYQMTYAKRSGHGGYLSREFFTETAAGMASQVVMVLARMGHHWVAGALYFRSGDTLYGRYWGCERELDCLHFEACYYQGIEYCIAQGIARFDPGAQGEHKIQRGFRPVKTYSNHWIADPRLSAAVGDFTRREQSHIDAYIEQAGSLLPFKAEHRD
jgi:predicted N-acyltransferase